MAGNRVCKLIICNGEGVIICGPAWWMANVANGASGAWLHCLLGHREFSRQTDPATGVSFTLQKARATQRSYREGDVVPDPGPHPEDKTFLEKYWLPLLAAAVILYFYFFNKK